MKQSPVLRTTDCQPGAVNELFNLLIAANSPVSDELRHNRRSLGNEFYPVSKK